MTERAPSPGFWQGVGSRFLPFADAASAQLPLSRILRLALFQVSVGVAAVLLNGTLNRVLIVEMDTPTWIVALMIAMLEKRAGLQLTGDDVFVNIAGGLEVDEPAADLGVVTAIASKPMENVRAFSDAFRIRRKER